MVDSMAISRTGQQPRITNFFKNYGAANTYSHRPLPEGTEGISTDIWYANYDNLTQGKTIGPDQFFEDQTLLDPIRGKNISFKDKEYANTHDGELPFSTWGCIA